MQPGEHLDLMTKGAAERRIWWHRVVRRHYQLVHRFTVPPVNLRARLVFCSCGEVWCL